MGPLLGPAIGPVAGSFIAQATSWRWIFWATSAASLIIQAAGLFCLQETYAPSLLKKKADALRKSTGDMTLHTEFEDDKTLPKVLRTVCYTLLPHTRPDSDKVIVLGLGAPSTLAHNSAYHSSHFTLHGLRLRHGTSPQYSARIFPMPGHSLTDVALIASFTCSSQLSRMSIKLSTNKVSASRVYTISP